MIDTASIPGAIRTIANRYDVFLDRTIGQGGMAVVYEGRDLKTRRRVAIKTLRPEFQRDPDARHRFRREARMMAMVKHPNLVTIYDLLDETSGSWLVMELVDGQNLRAMLEEQGTLGLEDVMDVLAQIGSGLSHMHERTLVHLDVKPQNIIWQPDGTIKLIDFGLAQQAGRPQDTVGGNTFGTAAYLSPEQATGHNVTPQSDVYALACVAYELLTGATPFADTAGADRQALVNAHLHDRATAPSRLRPDLDLPDWVDNALDWALERDPAERILSVDALAEVFDAGLMGEPVYRPVNPARRSGASDIAGTTGIFRAATSRFTLRRAAPAPAALVAPPPSLPAPEPDPPATMEPGGSRNSVARLPGWVRRPLWKIARMLVIFAILMSTITALQGGPEQLLQRIMAVAPGTTTEIVVDAANLRVGPGQQNALIAPIPRGTEARVVGTPVMVDGVWWYHIEVQVNGAERRGWLFEDGLRENGWMTTVRRIKMVENAVTQPVSLVRELISEVHTYGPVGRLARHTFSINS